MKKNLFLILLLAIVLVFTLISCGNNTNPGSNLPPDEDPNGGEENNCEHANIVPDYAVDPTCTEDGLTYGIHCGDCSKVLASQKVVPMLGHTEVATEDILPTCTEKGYVNGKHCSVCKEVIVAPFEVDAYGHDEKKDADKTPTCSEYGFIGGISCNTCGKVLQEGQQVDMLEHTEVSIDKREPTCTEYGYIGGTQCSVCNAVLVKGEPIAPLGHKETVIKGYEATCSKTGMSDGKYCSVCKKMTIEQVTLDMLSHAEIVTPGVKSTCQSEGQSEKRVCSTCGKVTLESHVIPIGEHTVVIDKAVEATCSTTGLTEGSHCSVCNEVFKRQYTVEKNNTHVYDNFATVTKAPTTSAQGTGTISCSKCGNKKSITFDKLTTGKLTSSDIYSIETDKYNPAYDNRWTVIDGKTSVSSIYSAGDWFGNVGDVLTITLNQEMVLTGLKMYTAGNYTYATVRVKDTTGKVTLEKSVRADGAANGGTAQVHTLASGKSIKAYTIEIEITALKWNDAKTFKVAELEITASKQDPRISHTHNYREFVETSTVATCQVNGVDVYQCFCGHTKEIQGSKGDHKYETLTAYTAVSCDVNGKETYACVCGAKKTYETEAPGHVYYKLVKYNIEPTTSMAGVATLKCNSCNRTDSVVVPPLAIEEVNYLRVYKIENGTVILKLNIYGDRPSYEIRYSTSEITEENYKDATIINATVDGDRLITLTLSLDASLSKHYYVAVRPYNGENYGKIATVRVGGGLEVPIDYSNAGVYHGEVLNSFRSLFDDDVTTALGVIFPNSGDTKELYGSNLSPIIDLEYMHYITNVRLYFASADCKVTVRWSEDPLDFKSEDYIWNGVSTFTSKEGWNEIAINRSTRYIQIIFVDGFGPSEVEAYGYQCGDGDEISTTTTTLPTLGAMMGMCGFVAGGGGHTPIEDVSCVGVLREYHNFGWTYSVSRYGRDAAFFKGSWMCNFDYEYQAFTSAGLNVIPCVQWAIGSGESISYKVNENNEPIYSNGSLVKSSFWERFNPHTYFVYADSMYAFAARYGRNTSQYLLNIAKNYCQDTPSVGQGTIQWIEMGNEPEGSWNGIHNYLSAYQLAAATSAAYDGHCSTLICSVPSQYHLGAKNADVTMKMAMAGVSGVSNEYITALMYWMKANRPDGKTAFDAFNVHHYMTKIIELPNGSTTYVGISPEEANITGILSQLIGIRNKYYPEKEVWITEFGWDTNQSYATSTSSHAYANFTGREVQAMWLTRTYLLLSSIGVDKADMYMAHDAGIEATAVGKYGSSGVIAYEYDENGNKIKVKKDSFYYLYTLKNTLGNYTFDSQIESYDENVMIFKYKTAEGKTAYAVWCKTSDGTVSENYQLGIGSSSATLVENKYGEISGVSTKLTADSLGYVSINVSEKPIYILVD